MQLLFRLIIFLSLLMLSLSANEKVSLLLQWKHQFQFAGFYVAKEKGFYKDVGLDVEIREYEYGINAIEKVLSSEVDFALGRSSLILKKLQGKPIVLLNAIYQSSPLALIALERPDLQFIKDFQNKKIMLTNDLESIAAISSMMRVNDIKEKSYTPIKQTFNLEDLLNGNTDLITGYISNEPYQLQQMGIPFKIFDPSDYGFHFYSDFLYTSLEYTQQHPQITEKFQQASLKGWEYAFSHIEESVSILMQKYNSQGRTREALLYEAKVLKDLAYKDGVQLGTIQDSRLKEIASIYRLLGMTQENNSVLNGLIYHPYSTREYIISLFSPKLFLIIAALILLTILLSLYKQHILKKQNSHLEQIVDEKTKELQNANKYLEERVKERTEELLIAMRAKSDFLANMSHEIRTPLNGIIGFVEILCKNEADNDKQKKLSIIRESSHSLLTIINDILDFSKIQSHKLITEKIPIEPAYLFEHIIALFSSKAKEEEISLTLNIDERLPKKMLGDSTRIKQIFSNLLSNAIKFSHENSTIEVNIKYLEQENKLFCEVIDSGKGIAQQHKEKIFQSFEQADSSVSRTHGGTGLGLSISKALVELMGGSIGVESTLGVGSRFYFTIQLFELTQELLEEEIPELNLETLTGHILIVEDNKTNQLLLGMLLEEHDLTYDIANDGLEALEAVKKENYSLILMDENMPNMSGKEATQLIKKMPDKKEIPIIAVTANALKGDKKIFLQSGMDDYIAKPIDADELARTLQKYL